jgi:hypothetical protein
MVELPFPQVLLASTPNDGSQLITLPNTPTGAARIKVEALGNIFYDISNNNFVIAAPLPISLLSFEGEALRSYNRIMWETENEINLGSYQLERSNDGFNFESIATISPATPTGATGKNNYSYNDKTPINGANYYRLKSIDIDKSESFSNVIKLSQEVNNNIEMYPNPANDVLNIDIKSNITSTLTIKIVDISGRVLIQQSIDGKQGLNSIQLDIHELATGMYSVQIIENKSLIIVEKLTKK